MGEFKKFQELKNKYIAARDEIDWQKIEAEAQSYIARQFQESYDLLIKRIAAINPNDKNFQTELSNALERAERDQKDIQDLSKKPIADLVNQ